MLGEERRDLVKARELRFVADTFCERREEDDGRADRVGNLVGIFAEVCEACLSWKQTTFTHRLGSAKHGRLLTKHANALR